MRYSTTCHWRVHGAWCRSSSGDAHHHTPRYQQAHDSARFRMASGQKKPAIDAHPDRGVIVKLRQSPAILGTVLAEKLAASTAMMAPDDEIELKAARRAKLDCLVVGPLCTSRWNHMRERALLARPHTITATLCVCLLHYLRAGLRDFLLGVERRRLARMRDGTAHLRQQLSCRGLYCLVRLAETQSWPVHPSRDLA